MTTSAPATLAPLSPPVGTGAGSIVRDSATIYRRATMRMLRAPVQLYVSLVQPLVWFVLFGQLFSRLTTGFGMAAVLTGQNPIVAQFGTANYSAFFLPAIIIQMMLFGAANSALGIITDDQSGYLNRLRVAPINRLAILAGNLLADLTRMLLQVAILLLVGLLFGVRFEYPGLLLFTFVLAALFGLMMGGAGIFVALTTRNTQATFLLLNFFMVPLLFTSSAQLPAALLPDWLQTVSHFNPVTYAINATRVIVTGLNAQQVAAGESVMSVIGLGVGVMLVLATLALTAATLRFHTLVR